LAVTVLDTSQFLSHIVSCGLNRMVAFLPDEI
jgi:hypothetical protein